MGRKGWVSLSVGWVTLFLMGTDLFVVSPLLPFISEEFHMSSATAGWMVTVFAITYAVSAPFFGWLSDKKGRRNLIALGLFFFALSNAFTAFASSFAWLMVSRILAGFSVASITPLIYAVIGDISPSTQRGVWLSIVVSGHLTALWAGAPIGTLMQQLLGWRMVFIVMAIAGVILALINFQAWRDAPNSNLHGYLIGRNLPAILRSVSVTTVWAISMYTLYIYLGAALYSENDYTASEIALAVTMYGIGAVVGSLASGQLTDKFGEKRISIVTLILLVVNLIVIGFFFTSGDFVYSLLFLWALVGYAGFTSYQARLAVEYPADRGIVMAWNNTALYFGITCGSMIGGIVISYWGFMMLPFVCACAALISFVLSTQKGPNGSRATQSANHTLN